MSMVFLENRISTDPNDSFCPICKTHLPGKIFPNLPRGKKMYDKATCPNCGDLRCPKCNNQLLRVVNASHLECENCGQTVFLLSNNYIHYLQFLPNTGTSIEKDFVKMFATAFDSFDYSYIASHFSNDICLFSDNQLVATGAQEVLSFLSNNDNGKKAQRLVRFSRIAQIIDSNNPHFLKGSNCAILPSIDSHNYASIVSLQVNTINKISQINITTEYGIKFAIVEDEEETIGDKTYVLPQNACNAIENLAKTANPFGSIELIEVDDFPINVFSNYIKLILNSISNFDNNSIKNSLDNISGYLASIAAIDAITLDHPFGVDYIFSEEDAINGIYPKSDDRYSSWVVENFKYGKYLFLGFDNYVALRKPSIDEYNFELLEALLSICKYSFYKAKQLNLRLKKENHPFYGIYMPSNGFPGIYNEKKSSDGAWSIISFCGVITRSTAYIVSNINPPYLLFTMSGNIVKTENRNLAYKILDSLEKFQGPSSQIASIFAWYEYYLDCFTDISVEEARQIVKNSFNTDDAISSLYDESNPHSIWSSESIRTSEINAWIDKCNQMECSAIFVLANHYNSLNIAFVLTWMLENFSGDALKRQIHKMATYLHEKLPTITMEEMKNAFEVYVQYYDLSHDTTEKKICKDWPNYDVFNSGLTNPTYKATENVKYTPILDNASNDVPTQIRKYKELYDDGILTKEEYEAKKRQLLELPMSSRQNTTSNPFEKISSLFPWKKRK